MNSISGFSPISFDYGSDGGDWSHLGASKKIPSHGGGMTTCPDGVEKIHNDGKTVIIICKDPPPKPQPK